MDSRRPKQESQDSDLTCLPPRAARKVMAIAKIEEDDVLDDVSDPEDATEDDSGDDIDYDLEDDSEYNPSKPSGPRKRKTTSTRKIATTRKTVTTRKRATSSTSSSSGPASASGSPSPSDSSTTSSSRTSRSSTKSTFASKRARTVKKPHTTKSRRVRTKTPRAKKTTTNPHPIDSPQCRILQTNYDCSEGFDAKTIVWDDDNTSPCLVAGCTYKFLRHRGPDAKRHLVAHSRRYRYAHSPDNVGMWVCRGIPVPEGEAPEEYNGYVYKGQWRYGGCLTKLSRRDALVRHLKKFQCEGTASQTD